MTLFETISNAYEEDNEFAMSLVPGCEQVVGGELYDQSRWSTFIRYVYKLDNEYVEVIEEQGSTEYQDGDYGAQINVVYPYEVTVIQYSRKPVTDYNV